jgi:hypothetical protein
LDELYVNLIVRETILIEEIKKITEARLEVEKN